MPQETAMPDGVNKDKALNPDDGITIPRLSLKEQGFSGLKTTNGYVWEESNRAFRFPAMLKLVDELRLNPTVATCLTAYKLLMSRAEWYIESPVGATSQEIERGKFVASCMDDMEESWKSTAAGWFDYMEYGSHVSEKVYRRRLFKNGSKYNDGLVGIRKIAPRARSSIQRWMFSDDGRDLLGVEQSLRYMAKSYLYMDQTDEQGLIPISREKFLLFVCDGYLGNPEGNSILKSVYLAAKQLTLLQEQELLSVAKAVQGLLKIAIPPKYLDPNASAADAAVLAAFQAIITNYNSGTQRGLLVPNMIDPESKLPLFTYEIMGEKGQASIDVGAIVARLQGDILSAMSCDVLKMGADAAGSFSLADGATNILSLAVSHRLNEIADVLNTDLVVQLYELNGWEKVNLPKFKYKDISPVSKEEASKFIQRVMSVGGIEMDRGIFNKIRVMGGFEPKPEDAPIDFNNLSTTLAGKSSSAGQGMEVGVVGDGTSTKPGGKDKSAQNADNKA